MGKPRPGAAEDVSRHLIEQDDQRQAAARAARPRVELAAQRALEQGPEFRADVSVARRGRGHPVAAEPERGSLREARGIERWRSDPVVENVVRAVHDVTWCRLGKPGYYSGLTPTCENAGEAPASDSSRFPGPASRSYSQRPSR